MNSDTEFPACKKIKLLSDTDQNVFPVSEDKTALLSCDTLKINTEKNISDECNHNKIDALLDTTECEIDLVGNEDDLFVFPPDEEVSDMLDDIELTNTFPTVTDRYLTAYYKVNVQKPGDDICIMIHSNRICMLCLAPSHTIFKVGKKITKVDFKVSDKVDRALNKVSGKGKHGAQPLQANSNICTVSCSDGQMHTIKCCMVGKLVEVNEMLLEDPELLRKVPHKGGYLAIVLPNIQLLDKIKESLLTEAQYKSILKELNNKNVHNECAIKEDMVDDCIAKELSDANMDSSELDSNPKQPQSTEISGHMIKS